MADGEDLILFEVFDDRFKANIVKGVLETNGVPCMLTNEVMSSVLPFTESFMSEIRLLIFRKDYQLAQKIMLANPIDEE
ncbi:MAG: DUF2007 domain-containing protein [Bacteroidales bacterium]